MPIIDPEDLGGGYYTDPRFSNGPDPNPRTPGQQPPETGPGYGKQSSDQRAMGMLTPQQRQQYESLLAQVQSAAGGYYNPRLGVAIARGLQNGMSPELIMQQVNSYIGAENGGAPGYEGGYNAFATSHDGGQNLLNRMALGYWGNRRDAYGGPITQPGTYGNGEPGGGVPYDGPHTYDPTGGTRPGRGGPPPTGGGETRGGGLGEPTGGGSGGAYDYNPTGGGGRGDRGGDGGPPVIDPPGRTPDPKPGQGGGAPRGDRMTYQPPNYGAGYGQQAQAQQQQPTTVTVRYQYGGGAQPSNGAPQQPYQPPQQVQNGTDRSNIQQAPQQPPYGAGYAQQPSMRRTQPTAPDTQPRYVAPMAQSAQNRQGPAGYGQGAYGKQSLWGSRP